jgi:phospholipase C
MTKSINYITGDTTLSQDEKTSMGFVETTQYASFKLAGIEWRIYKRGYQTEFDTQ